MLPPQSNLLARPPSGQLQSLTLHDCASHDNRVSHLVADEYGGSGLVAHTPHQVEDGVLHTAPTGGVADCRLRGHSVLHWEVRGAPRVEAAALLVGVGKGGEALGEVACETHQGECWLIVWSGYGTKCSSTSVVKQETRRVTELSPAHTVTYVALTIAKWMKWHCDSLACTPSTVLSIAYPFSMTCALPCCKWTL